MSPNLTPAAPGQARPLRALSTTLAIAFALLMLYLPFQFQSLPLRFIYPHLRLFGLAYGVAGLFLAFGSARVGLPPWVPAAGKLLLAATLAMQGYLVSYLPGVVNGEVYYTSLVMAVLLAELRPKWEQALFASLYSIQLVAMGVLVVMRPAFFPVTVFGHLHPAFGPILILAGAQLAVAFMLPRRWRPQTWAPTLLAGLAYGWFAYYWVRVGNWVGISAYGTMALTALGHTVYLWRPWRWRVPGLQRRVLALAVISSVLPLVCMGAFAVYAAQALDADASAKSLTVTVLQAKQALEQLALQPDASRSPAELTAAARRLVPATQNTLEVLPLDESRPSLTGVAVNEEFATIGVRRLTAAVNLPSQGVTVVAFQPVSTVYEQADQVGLLALLLTIAMGLLAMVVGVTVSRRITGPLADVRSVASAISRRHFAARIQRQPSADDEVSDLIVTFNSMAETLEAYSNELQRLLAVTDTALSHMSLDNLVDQLLHRGREALAADTCVILLLSDDGRYLAPAGTLGVDQSLTDGLRIPIGKGFVGRIAETGQPLVLDELMPTDVVLPAFRQLVHSVAGAPLLVEGRVIGVITVGSITPRHFTDDDLRLLQLVADRVALALDHARLFSEVRELNTTLEQRVTERTAELLAANKELEAFSYSVSHDLRSPLRNIDGFSQALLEDYSDRLDEEGRDYLNRTRSSIRRMGQLIDALLQLSRVSRTQLDRQPVNLSALVASVVVELRRLAPSREVAVEIQPGAVVNADPRLLRIVIENLLHNAWKFTGRQPHPHIAFGMTKLGHEPVYFICDNGAGFDMAYADKLFTAFQRLHSETQYEGAGIGLATVQRIIQRHGGRIWAEGAVDRGATFYFTL